MEISLTFLEPQEVYKYEKPYELHLSIPEGCNRTNLVLKEHDGIHLTNVREDVKQYKLENYGFEYLKSPTKALALPLHSHVSDMSDPSIRDYLQEVISLVKKRLFCEQVLLYDWRLRREGLPAFDYGPRSTDRLAPLAVAHVVHQDYSYEGGFSRLKRQLTTEELAEYTPKKYHIQIYNIWRPLVSVVASAPLAIADRNTFRKADLAEVDKVHEDHLEEGILAHYRPEQRWFWMSDQTFDEPVMFLGWDSDGCDPVVAPPHASFRLPGDHLDGPLRESVEVRVMVFRERGIEKG